MKTNGLKTMAVLAVAVLLTVACEHETMMPVNMIESINDNPVSLVGTQWKCEESTDHNSQGYDIQNHKTYELSFLSENMANMVLHSHWEGYDMDTTIEETTEYIFNGIDTGYFLSTHQGEENVLFMYQSPNILKVFSVGQAPRQIRTFYLMDD